MTIEIPSEFVEQIIIQELSWHYSIIKPNDTPPMYSYDPVEDEKAVRKLKKALKEVLRYYGHDV